MNNQNGEKYFDEYPLKIKIRDKNRLETFIDGVFAIAITLLGLEFVTPVVYHSDQALIGFFSNLHPLFLGYFLSFLLLGILLNIHHRQFRYMRCADTTNWWINIILLSFIVLVPFATSIWTDYPETRVAVLFFQINMLIASLMLLINWEYVKRRPKLLFKNVSPQDIKIISYRNLAVPVASLIAIFLAFINPFFSNLAYGFIIIIFFLANRHQRVLIKKVDKNRGNG
ncbi:TMEM175 family protein [Methanobacterium alcaliphilum]|uniref:TMEM175 family protein n=1 Tax=Methanobacterium alcaliphilum TaxID=392018 RepID=UPI00200A3286|nr:TMEM175 family protein [Methanobacterium alcaliphilum]MCK9151194.1 TMEM175 family protein [Methanobacterium alcaliphilum]